MPASMITIQGLIIRLMRLPRYTRNSATGYLALQSLENEQEHPGAQIGAHHR